MPSGKPGTWLASCGWNKTSSTCRLAMRLLSASVAFNYRAGSDNAWPWGALCWQTLVFWCWMIPPVPWTQPRKRRCFTQSNSSKAAEVWLS